MFDYLQIVVQNREGFVDDLIFTQTVSKIEVHAWTLLYKIQ
jgi:hypothetical protein